MPSRNHQRGRKDFAQQVERTKVAAKAAGALDKSLEKYGPDAARLKRWLTRLLGREKTSGET